MKPDFKWIESFSNGCLAGLLAAVILLCVLIMSLGCATCPPCQPRVETVEVKVPVYSCPEPPELPETLLVQYPALPGNPSDQDWKDWYAEMVATAKARHQILLDHLAHCKEILSSYATQ